MANQEHLDILRQGVEVWNKRREEHLEIHDLSGADLHGMNLRNADLYYANLPDVQVFLPKKRLMESTTLRRITSF